MRIAAYNVENLFDRARVFEAEPAISREILDAEHELTALFERPAYDAAAQARMVELFGTLGLLRADEGPYVRLRRLRGRILQRTGAGAPQIVAEGRGDWVGWLELRTTAVRETAMQNTARVILDLRADILAVVEAESRPVLLEFQDRLLPDIVALDGRDLPAGLRYAHVMLIDGNDARGIDVGLGTRRELPIRTLRSHVNDVSDGTDGLAAGDTIFSRDCPEYEVVLPAGDSLWVLPNHFKSKFGGDDARARARRRAQAQRVAAIYRRLRAEGQENVVVLGDLNDTPDSDALAPLLAGTDLRDVSGHEAFTDFEFRGPAGRGIGTYGLGNDRDKIDYLLLSPALWPRVTNAGLFRKGAWPGSRPARWEVYPTLKSEKDAASDHHAIFADLDL